MFIDSLRTKGFIIICALLCLGIVGSAILEVSGADIDLTSCFYRAGGANGGWTLGATSPWKQLYRYGEYSVVAFALGVLVLLIASWKGRVRREYTKPALVVILTVIIGPGILVNGILKEYWGRPRPVDTIEFGGQQRYRRVLQPGTPGNGKSFTCGHCAMAFSVVSGAAFYPLHPTAAVTMVAVGTAYGIVMGVARIAQGGHFPTDVLWSGILVCVVIVFLYYFVFRIPEL
ncbi:phosphatase PAP2 family protein [Desulfomonile tiedjei]|uniref:PAP2 (Acid phosphatase) superfamily protein n=1 Tax=Desulfomonile tiedjei (strain ATCC 49306 / DSM 6799 / DCB-1) TaxID=706587 RepID=I4CA16_DESTA|nr:phosphatase PAP2 family protein [Desulfomonile tiedjei]AFM26407.1 PAP2 (acid phosphatase) superfamily protein [Desulfomonile tiedjei DSM 6799]